MNALAFAFIPAMIIVFIAGFVWGGLTGREKLGLNSQACALDCMYQGKLSVGIRPRNFEDDECICAPPPNVRCP